MNDNAEQSLRLRWVSGVAVSAALVFDVRFENFERRAADGAEEEPARPEGAQMFSVVDGAEAVQNRRCAPAFERANEVAEYYCGRVPYQHMDMVLFAVPVHNFGLVICRDFFHTGLEKVSLLRSECMPSELRTEHDVRGQVVNTVACTVKIKIPDTLAHRLDSLRCSICHRNVSSDDLVPNKKHCRACRRARQRKCVQKNPEKERERDRRRNRNKKYGLSFDAYLAMVRAQAHRCAICNRLDIECPRGTLYVDHCHASKNIRGLLCQRCNSLLGNCNDDPLILEAAAKYLVAPFPGSIGASLGPARLTTC